jgi:Tat protein secretion system quality control protein TatD with DNase activity
MNSILASFVFVYLEANQKNMKKNCIDCLTTEITDIAEMLLSKGENVDSFFDFFLTTAQTKNYLVQVVCCQILYKLVCLHEFETDTDVARKVLYLSFYIGILI